MLIVSILVIEVQQSVNISKCMSNSIKGSDLDKHKLTTEASQSVPVTQDLKNITSAAQTRCEARLVFTIRHGLYG